MQMVLSCCWNRLRITKYCIYNAVLREKIINYHVKELLFVKEKLQQKFICGVCESFHRA